MTDVKIVMDEVDRLRLQNVALKVASAGYKEMLAQAQLKEAVQCRLVESTAFAKIQQDMSLKYGLDLTKHTVRDDGTIEDRSPAGELAALHQQLLGQKPGV